MTNISIVGNPSRSREFPAQCAVAAAIAVLAAVLPQIVHAAAGAEGGAKWLPMYLPVVLGGCLLGAKSGVLVGILSPTLSFAVTAAFGNAMPAAARLPFMTAELAMFGLVSGSFSGKIVKHALYALPATLCAAVCGRAFFLLLALVFRAYAPFSFAEAWAQAVSGLSGVLLMLALVPAATAVLNALAAGRKRHD